MNEALQWAVALLCLSALGCGSKTGLEVEPCGDAGMRSCVSACGPGSQTCERGVWSACVSDVLERDCGDTCGEGSQLCTQAGWTMCEVPPAERRCEDACGVGSQVCLEGAWSECDVAPTERPCSSSCGEGIQACLSGSWGPCSAVGPRPPVLSIRVRDFRDTHPDFEDQLGNDRGIVEEQLGSDGLPVYAGETRTTHGAAAFDQWFRDVPGVNLSTSLEVTLEPTEPGGDVFTFDDPEFFPVDGQLFGDEGRAHNFHFTLEIATEFVYRGGETFRFRGDDDVFVFIDRRLVIDLGGVHRAQGQTVELDGLGLSAGERYPLHLFFAERHTGNSSFRIETTVQDPHLCE